MKEEFEERVGLKVTNKEYTQIEEAYMAGSENKDVFCQEWLKNLTGADYKRMAERKIEIEYPPMAKGTLTSKTFMETVLKKVQKLPEYERAKPIIDYMMADDYMGIREITNYEFRFYALITYPNNEGIYIDCWLRGGFDDSPKKENPHRDGKNFGGIERSHVDHGRAVRPFDLDSE
jgi:hypothetical protein